MIRMMLEWFRRTGGSKFSYQLCTRWQLKSWSHWQIHVVTTRLLAWHKWREWPRTVTEKSLFFVCNDHWICKWIHWMGLSGIYQPTREDKCHFFGRIDELLISSQALCMCLALQWMTTDSSFLSWNSAVKVDVLSSLITRSTLKASRCRFWGFRHPCQPWKGRSNELQIWWLFLHLSENNLI